MSDTPDARPAKALRRASPAVSWIGTPLIALITLAVMAVIATPLLRAGTGTGTKGTFVATNFRCSNVKNGRSCIWYGTFTSDSGRSVPDVQYNSSYPPLSSGSSIAAQDDGFIQEIGVSPLPLRGNDRLFGPFGLLLVLWPVLWLGGWAWVVPLRYARWHHGTDGSPQPPAGGKRVIPPPWHRDRR